MSVDVDILVENGEIIDGTGAPAYEGGLAVTDGRITAVGDMEGFSASYRIDAKNKVVTPGFIDCHTHDDRALLDEPQMAFKVTQGITTVVAGNCGISLAPFSPNDDWDMPVPMSLLGRKDQYCFPTFSDYIQAFRSSPPAVNAALLCGHNTLRAEAMDGDIGRPAEENEINQMRETLKIALNSGAIGLSSGLMYPAGFFAPTSEVSSLAFEVGRLGGLYTTHLRDEADKLLMSVEEAAEIGRVGDLPVVLSHHKVTGRFNWGATKESLKRIEQLSKGQTIFFDVYPYTASATALMPDRISIAEKILIVVSNPFPSKAGCYLKDIAEEWCMSEVEAAEKLSPAQAIYFAMDEADVRRVLSNKKAMVGSDGIPSTKFPHPRLWGAFPRVLGHYSREIGLFDLETAVHKMTGLTAQVFGFKDRGVLRKGAVADITVFDPKTIIDRASFENPVRQSEGVEFVIVGGEITLENGQQTMARPGCLVFREVKNYE